MKFGCLKAANLEAGLEKMIFSTLDIVLFVSYFILLFLSIFWLLVLFTTEEKEAKPRDGQRTPFFSVVVPAYNEEKSIIGTLNSLVGLDYPREKMEIIVVNNGSTDRTQEIVEEFMVSHQQDMIQLVNQPIKGKGKALNSGLSQIKGEFFACLDADSFVEKNALGVMLPYFEDENVAAVCPVLKVQKPDSILQKVQWSEYILNMFYRFLNARLDCIHVTPGPFSIYRTEIIRKLGGYDETTITEDLELAIRLQKHQYRIVHAPKAMVETIAPNTWGKLFRQRVRWYKGSVDNTFRYKELIFNKRYGDFGIVRMPTIILSGAMAIILTLALSQEFLKKLFHWLVGVSAVHFDIVTLVKNFSFHFNLLSLPFFKLSIAVTIIGISILIMVMSYKVVGENITNYGRTWASLFTYILIYGLFIAVVWIYIAVLVITRKKDSW